MATKRFGSPNTARQPKAPAQRQLRPGHLAAAFLDDPTQCTHVEYGNSLSFMGGGAMHPSAYHKYAQGWIGKCNVVSASSGTFTLVPHRGRVLGAKFLAAVMVGVAAMVIAGAVGALGTLVGSTIAGVGPVTLAKRGMARTFQLVQIFPQLTVAETIAGRGVLGHEHPMNAGPLGVIGSSSANALAAEADVVLALGTRLQDFTTGSWTVFQAPDVKLIAVNAARFDDFEVIAVDPSEPFAANALRIADTVIYPREFHVTCAKLEQAGVLVRPVEAGELAKAEGGVTCCSLVVRGAG